MGKQPIGLKHRRNIVKARGDARPNSNSIKSFESVTVRLSLGSHVSLDCALEHNPFAYNLKIYQNRHIRSGLTQIFHSSLRWICWFWKDWQSCHVRNLLRQLRAQLLKYSGSKTTFIRLLLSSRMADSIKSSIVRLKRANWEETHTARVTVTRY